jgi:hypothetical protein
VRPLLVGQDLHDTHPVAGRDIVAEGSHRTQRIGTVARETCQQGLGGGGCFHAAGPHLDGDDGVGSQSEALQSPGADRDGLTQGLGVPGKRLGIGVQGVEERERVGRTGQLAEAEQEGGENRTAHARA